MALHGSRWKLVLYAVLVLVVLLIRVSNSMLTRQGANTRGPDQSRVPVSFSATVQRVDWTSPNAVVHVNSNTEGGVKAYRITLDSPDELTEKGWRPDSLQPGEEVTVKEILLQSPNTTSKACCLQIIDRQGREIYTGDSVNSQ